uniref:16S rRNA (uracil(1498)-N(3))-methyltransferase n=1 Tax=Brachybacterium sp. GPGPB12 TaxID=3023517 RepID=UPI00404B6CF5
MDREALRLRMAGEKLAKGRAKWEGTARAAVKQCRRPGIPAVDAPMTTSALVEDLRARAADGTLVLVLHEQESVGVMSLAEEPRGASEAGMEEIVVVVGPEGGIDDSELEARARPVPGRCRWAPRCCAPPPPAPRPSRCSARWSAAGAEPTGGPRRRQDPADARRRRGPAT